MIHVRNHLDMLGKRVTDKVTGFNGVVTSVSFDLYGCVTGLVHPGAEKEGKLLDQLWFDISRLSVTNTDPVMQRPNYEFGIQAEGRQGAAEKPLQNKS